MDQVWKGLSNLDPRDPGGFYKKPLLNVASKYIKLTALAQEVQKCNYFSNATRGSDVKWR